jgi:nucleolar pre-ribosomal-associated protein 1
MVREITFVVLTPYFPTCFDQMLFTASAPRSYLYILLHAFNTTEVLAIRRAITLLFDEIFSSSILFQEDPDEFYIWLDSLPTTRRAQGTEAPDGAVLTDEGNSVIGFLDDCVQRCLKTAYRYLEDRDALARSALMSIADDVEDVVLSHHPEVLGSPLLITVLDQLGHKVLNKLLTSSDVLAITSFIRKLVFGLSSKQRSLDFLRAFTDKVDVIVHPGLFPQYSSITVAIRHEMAILRSSLCHMHSAPVLPPSSTSTVVQQFLDCIEKVPIRQYPFYFLDDIHLLIPCV